MRILLASLLLSAPSSAVGTAHALEGETCMDKPVTITDLDGGDVVGTDGDDVIATAPDVTVVAGAGHDTICVFGTDDADYVDIQDGEDVSVWLGGGFDTLHLSSVGGGTGAVDSGAGGAYIQVVPDRSVVLDLQNDDLLMDGDSSYTFTGAWDVTASAKRVRLQGDDRANHLRALDISCHVAIAAGRVDDWLEVAPNTIEVPDISCSHRTAAQLFGQNGNDLMVGWKNNDRLYGGDGRDTAKGGLGKDTCQAEVKRSCER